MGKAYIRKKGTYSDGETKYIIEQDNKFVATVPRIKKLIELTRPKQSDGLPSQNYTGEKKIDVEKFPQSLLSEPDKLVNKEEIEKALWEITKDILK